MSNNFTLGSDPIPADDPCVLKFHQYPVYDRSWTTGYLYFDAETGIISTVSTPPQQEAISQPAAPTMNRKLFIKK